MSAEPSTSQNPLFTEQELLDINAKLAGKSPQEILEWAIDTIPQGQLWQTTAFGLFVPPPKSPLPTSGARETDLSYFASRLERRTGLASLAMISDISLSRDETHLVPLIFLDTLHHFPATLDLATRAAERYLAELHTFRPLGKDGKELSSAKEFEVEYGPRLWETEEDMYDYLVKVRPCSRAVEAGF